MSQSPRHGRGRPRGRPPGRGGGRGRGRGSADRSGSDLGNLADDALLANSADTEGSEIQTPPDNLGRRATVGGPINAPPDDESHLSDASERPNMDIVSSPPLPRYPFPLGPGGSILGGRAIHVPEGAEYEEHIVDASPPPRFQSSDDSGPSIYIPASTSQHTSSSGPIVYTPQHTSSSGPVINTPQHTSSSGPAIHTPFSTSQASSSSGPAIRTRSARIKVGTPSPISKPSPSSRIKVETPSLRTQSSSSSGVKVEPLSSPSQFTPNSSETARPEPPSPERIRDSEEARSAKPKSNRYPAPPPPFASSDAFQQLHIDHPPPGYERLPAPAVRQGTETRWNNGVLSGGALINMLEDLSRSPQTEHERMCLWLQEHYTAPFGRFHNSDGLVIRSTEDLDMLCLAYTMWLEVKGTLVEGDVFFVSGLEPREVRNGWRNRALGNLPGLPNGFGHKIWKAGDAQYREGTYLKEKKGAVVEEKWTDGMRWEREIRTI